MNYRIQTKQLKLEADQLESFAKTALTSWIILGESHKYQEHMDRARKLRIAANLRKSDRDSFLA